MQKTPDEIKKALECCFYDSEQCADCPYYPVSCDVELVRDAREYIRQLEAELAEVCELTEFFRDKAVQLEERNKSMRENNDKLLALDGELHKELLEQRERADRLEAERDAAVEDIRLASTSYVGTCQTCKHCKNQVDCDEPEACGLCKVEDCPCRTCGKEDRNWEWRGVQKED